jgi:hypothetical protein
VHLNVQRMGIATSEYQHMVTSTARLSLESLSRAECPIFEQYSRLSSLNAQVVRDFTHNIHNLRWTETHELLNAEGRMHTI